MTKLYLHLTTDTVSTDPTDMAWIKVTPKGWWKVKFDKATHFDTVEEIRLALIQPSFTGVSGAMIVVKQELTNLGRP